MTQEAFSISAANRQDVEDYLRRQFATLSWWPKEGPLQAKEEFDRMCVSAETLSEWCGKWLNAAQRKQLQAEIGVKSRG